MRKLLVVLVLVLAAVAALAGPAGAIVHGFTPVDECAQSGNAGGVPAADDNPVFVGMPIPETASDGKAQGQANDAPVNC
jgi:hypothetical protein